MTLPKYRRDMGIEPNPCDERAEKRNWDAVRRKLGDIFNIIGDDDGDVINIIQGLLVRFELQEELEPGGSADATKLIWDEAGAAWTDDGTITVHDDIPSMPWQGLEGYTGWARRRESGDDIEHSIIWMERIAYRIWGTLDEDLEAGQPAQATVINFSDGVDPGATLDIYDVNVRWPEAKQGAYFSALYDFNAQRYELVNCQQRSWRATATATMNFSSSTATVTVNNVTFKSYSEFDLDTEVVTSAKNFLGLTGSNGNVLHLEKSAASGFWEIINVKPPSSDAREIVRFRLYEELPTGGDALANLVIWNGAAYALGAQIRVFDWWGLTTHLPGQERGMFQGVAGMEGWAVKGENQTNTPEEYDIIWMEQYARFIWFNLLEDMGETTAFEARALVVTSWGQGDAPDEEVIVHDPENKFPKGLNGAMGLAILDEQANTDDPTTPYYKIVVCQQQAFYGTAVLDETMCGEQSFEVAVQNFIPGANWLWDSQFPDPAVEEVLNPHFHYGAPGDFVFVAWGTTTSPEDGSVVEGWLVIDVTKKAQDVVFDFRIKADKTAIEALVTECGVEYCEDPVWEDKIPLTECP